MIYFFQDEETCHIKIGFTDGEPEERLKRVQSNSPSKLIILLTLKGGREGEQELHAKFAAARLHNEWFKPASAIIRFIIDNAHNDQTPALLLEAPELKTKAEQYAFRQLVGAVQQHGPLAWSHQGPLKELGSTQAENLMRIIYGSGGADAMDRVFDAVEAWTYSHFDEGAAACMMRVLDCRCDGIGGWMS
jgi:hypothetical protein